MRKAFKLAYYQTRWDIDGWSWYSYYQMGEEMLALVMVRVCRM